MAFDLPANAANTACYELVREIAPELWEAFQQRLLPAAEGDGDAAERIRALMRLEDEVWEAFVASDDASRRRALGRSWPCCVDDLIGAVATAAIPQITGSDAPVERRREQLEQLRTLLREERRPSLTTTTIGFGLQRALNEL